MTDKEKNEIDGVDVGGCKYYLRNIHKSCGQGLVDCEGKDCMFKQLARKTQECEELKKTVLTKCPNCNSEYLTPKGIELYEENQNLKQECEELKERASIAEDNFACEIQARLYHQNEWLKFSKECEELKKQLKTSEKWRINAESLKEEIEILQNNYDTATRDCNEEIERLEQKCEELKKQLMQKDEINTFFNTPIEGWSSNPCDICESKNNYEQLKQECEELKELLKLRADDRINKLERAIIRRNVKIERYRKALEEIEQELKEDIYCESQECGCDDFEECLRCTKDLILDIISKAKDGNE